MLRFSYWVVPLGYVPSTGIALTGSSSPRPAIIVAVTVCTKSGAKSGTIGAGSSVRARARPAARPGGGRQRAVHRRLVALHHLGAAAAVGLGDRGLDALHRPLPLEHAGDGEEAGLQHGVGAPGQPRRAGDLAGVDHVELDLLLEHALLQLARERVPHLVRAVAGVHQQRGSLARAVEHLGSLEDPALVAADEARLRDEVGRLDRLRAEAQVRDRLRARLLRVVDEVALRVQVLLAEDLDRVLVRRRPCRPSRARRTPRARWSSGSMSSEPSYSRLVCDTSSSMPIVKRLLGRSRPSSSNTAATMPGLNSFDERP